MKTTLGITWEDLDNYIDFSESRIFFNSSFDHMESFNVWGITILKAAECYKLIKEPSNLVEEQDIFVAGLSEVRLSKVHSGSLEVALYDQSGHGFIRDVNNNIVSISSKWGSKEMRTTKSLTLNSVIDWPFGFGDLKLNLMGDIQITIETDYIVSVNDYIMDTSRFGYKKNS
ncbi:hypothetical protein [Paenibacillus wynnii]|uniref:hypothetical protein n=1 Tax=Paenibacillus wynnii TaxID=268407 RepID=UPI00278F67E6|nr:hypothetical protein [Paenibacillus wynnii]MDQ0193380.1 hypothetical protein [Paenibacillus wynnii]